MRQEAARTFGLDYEEMNERHHLTFGTYEEGKLTLDEYLDRTVFYEERPFTREQFRDVHVLPGRSRIPRCSTTWPA